MGLKNRLFIMNKNEYTPLVENSRGILEGYLDMCTSKPDIDLSEVGFYWSPQLTGWGVRGVFTQYKPNSVFLAPVEDPFDKANMPSRPGAITPKIRRRLKKVYKENIKAIAPIVVHELTHMADLRAKGRIRYALCCVPGLYNTMLDDKAFANEKGAAYDLNLNADLYGREGKLLYNNGKV